MPNESRFSMRNDFQGPANRPLLRLSRFGGGGVFFVPGNELGDATAVHPTGKTAPFLMGVQGTSQRKGAAVTAPIPTDGVKGDRRGLGFRLNAYAPEPAPKTSRAGFFANRRGARCPHCGR